MALTKETKNDKIEVLQLAAGYPVVQVRQATIIAEDGVEISRGFHRHVISPLDDVSGESAQVQAIAAAVHTADVKSAYQAHLAAQAEL